MTETPTLQGETAPEPLDELAAALAAFQAEMPTVPKTKTARVRTRDGGDYSYTYADLADITAAAMPLLAKHGLAFSCLPGPDGLTGLLVHKSGQRLAAVLPIQGASPQQVGSSLTYMRRYLLGCLTGVVTDDDDDGQAAERASRAAPPPTPPVAPPRRQPRRVETADVLATEDNPGPDGSVDVPLPDPEPERKAVPDGTMRRLHATWADAFGNVEYDRDDRLAILARIVGRPLSSSSDLSHTEALQAIGFLERVKVGAAGVVRRGGQWVAVSYEEPPDER